MDTKAVMQVIVGLILIAGAIAVFAFIPTVPDIIPILMGVVGAFALIEGADL